MSEENGTVAAATTGDILGKKPRTESMKQPLKHQFTDQERLDLSEELADLLNDCIEAETEKTEVMSDYKAKIDNIKSQIGLTTRKITQKYEMRETECEIQYHVPETGKKRTVRLDNMAEVEVIKMTEKECQEVLPLEEA